MKKNIHANSLANLTYREGRPSVFGVKKKQRSVTVTEEGWENIQSIAKTSGCSSVSDLLEKIARGQINLSEAS